jgi:hypothetical protein
MASGCGIAPTRADRYRHSELQSRAFSFWKEWVSKNDAGGKNDLGLISKYTERQSIYGY